MSPTTLVGAETTVFAGMGVSTVASRVEGTEDQNRWEVCICESMIHLASMSETSFSVRLQ